MLKLERDIKFNSATYSGELNEALIDVQKGDVTSDKPVHVTFEQGTLDSNGLKITNSGDVVIFNGGVNMTVKPQQPAAAAPQAKPGAQ
jgi:lipopolysaccharide export system protein LptC